MIIDTLEVV